MGRRLYGRSGPQRQNLGLVVRWPLYKSMATGSTYARCGDHVRCRQEGRRRYPRRSAMEGVSDMSKVSEYIEKLREIKQAEDAPIELVEFDLDEPHCGDPLGTCVL